MKNKLITFIILLFISNNLGAKQISVLFFGNSITASGIPETFQQLALESGDTVFVEQHWGGQILQEYVQDVAAIQMTKDKLQERDWDYVVLQENSQLSGFYPGWNQGYFEYYSYAAAQTLNQLIRENNSCGETIFFMTYGYLDGDQMNFPDDTYEKQQTRIKRNYLLLADSNSSMLAPVGWAWRKVRSEKSWGDELYMPGDHHPAELGSYLASCVFYATILGKSPAGNKFIGTIPQDRALYLQSVAGSIVLTDKVEWNININVPNAYFDFEINQNNKVKFTTDISSKYVDYLWYFGDGDSSSKKEPIHEYSLSGDFIVNHFVMNECYATDTMIDTITIIPSSIKNNNDSELISVSPNPSTGLFSVNFGKSKIDKIQITTVDGKLIYQKLIKENTCTINLSDYKTGIYLLNVFTKGQIIRKSLLVRK
ncbi:MAG: T9SS type A sorting domain-containing protein [Bacteroidota bacterium]|nr:T9SS type A sorting domain-containing protein [Bacteroidota bacterium]